MKKIFRKAITVLGSAALIGATVGAAAAASITDEFSSSNTAIVVGANAAPMDVSGMGQIETVLNAASDGSATTLSGAAGVTEDEVVLGGIINEAAYKIETTMTDTKISSLMDEKISWDDGQGSDDYDVHEEIVINGDMSVITSLSDEDLTGVALTNNMALEYRYVFDDVLNTSAINAGDDEDDLYLTILGQSYEVTGLTNTTISVVTSDEMSVGIGESVTVEGKTFTVDDLSSDSARINGQVITIGTSGYATKKIDGLQVRISDIFYNDNFPEQASLTVRVGDNIEKTYTNGDEYIGQDEDDPLWVWTIVNASNAAAATSYIGVSYNVNINDADDAEAEDSIKYEGAGYILPENFAEVKLDGLTDVEYEDVTVKFTTRDLYNSSDSGTANEDAEVVVISGPATSFITVGSEETDEIYLYYANNGTAGTETTAVNGSIEVFYRDHEGDNTPTNKARYVAQHDLGLTLNLTETTIGTIEVGDSTVIISATMASGAMTLSFSNPADATTAVALQGIDLNVTDSSAITNTTGGFTQLGATAEDADVGDIKVNGLDVSTKEESIMNYYGIVVAEADSAGVEGNANEDEVTLSIPSDQVYATVSVVAGGEATTTGEDGVMTVIDTAASTVAGKNLIVVGGSAINAVAAELLGSAYSEAAFTSATGVGAGQFMIESFDRNGKVALLVAGYEAADTAKAVTYVLNNDVDTTEGAKTIMTSATMSVVA